MMFNTSKAFAIGLLVAVFLAGMALGAVGNHWARALTAPPRRDPRVAYVDRLARDLQLTPVQRDSIAAILRRYDPRMRALFASVRPQMDSLRQHLRDDIRAQLTAEQMTAYDRLMERERARFTRRDTAAQRTERHNNDD